MGALRRVFLSVVILPLGVLSIVSSYTRASFHATWNDVDRMGVSASSGWSRVSCAGVRPFPMCLQSCLAVRCAVCHWLT